MKTMKKILLLLLIPTFSFSQQFNNVDYSGLNTINISDNSYLYTTQDATILATDTYMYNNNVYGKIIKSFKSNSDQDALIDYTWKSDYIYRSIYELNEEVGDALVKGNNGTYYVIKMYSQWK